YIFPGEVGAALDINDGGVVLATTGQGLATWTRTGGKVSLGFSSGTNTHLSNTGLVVGSIFNPNTLSGHAVVWTQADGLVGLGTISGSTSFPRTVSANDYVIGQSSASRGVHGFLWTKAGGMVDVGTLGGRTSSAIGVNTAGQVVGYSAGPTPVPNGEEHA